MHGDRWRQRQRLTHVYICSISACVKHPNNEMPKANPDGSSFPWLLTAGCAFLVTSISLRKREIYTFFVCKTCAQIQSCLCDGYRIPPSPPPTKFDSGAKWSSQRFFAMPADEGLLCCLQFYDFQRFFRVDVFTSHAQHPQFLQTHIYADKLVPNRCLCLAKSSNVGEEI